MMLLQQTTVPQRLARFAIAVLRSSTAAARPPAVGAAAVAGGPTSVTAYASSGSPPSLSSSIISISTRPRASPPPSPPSSGQSTSLPSSMSTYNVAIAIAQAPRGPNPATAAAVTTSEGMQRHEEGISWMMGTKQQRGRTMADEGRRIGCGRKPRVVIIGAGMAGIAAAQRLQKYSGIELIILEASDRIGGRICSSEFNGEGIELGATWIHGIERSPLYEKALEIGAMENAHRAWEGKDGFLDNDVVKAEGGLEVPRELVEPVIEMYKHLLQDVQEMGEVQPKEMLAGTSMSAINASPVKMSNLSGNYSWGAFLRQGLDEFLAQQQGSSLSMSDHSGGQSPKSSVPSETQGIIMDESRSACQEWTTKSLREGIFKMHENLERNITSADDLYDVDLVDFNEYWEFPGEHKTIGKGYLSLVHALASELPSGAVQFGQNVEKIVWGDSSSSYLPGAPVRIHCKGGYVVEADHVILTVSLGVLKATTLGRGTKSSIAETQMNATKYSTACPSEALFSEVETKIQNLTRESDNNVEDENPSSAGSAELFDPPLPMWKLDSISRLGFGIVDKVFLQVDPAEEGSQHRSLKFIFHPSPRGVREEQEQEQCCSDIPPWIRKTYSLYPIHKNSHVLLAWFAGREALQVESLTDEEILSGISKTLASFGIPENQQGAFRAIRRSRWGQNPLFLGSYSYVKVGSTGEDIDTLAEPLPKNPGDGHGGAAPLQLLFAGEATHRHYYSTTHGAYFSGLREAERLLKHYGLLGH